MSKPSRACQEAVTGDTNSASHRLSCGGFRCPVLVSNGYYQLTPHRLQPMCDTRYTLCRLVLLAWLAAFSGCSPFDFSPARAIAIDRDRLQIIADEGAGDHLHYAGSDSEYHYLVDTRSQKGQAYKIEPKQLRLNDTFRRGEEEPYLVYPHVIAGKKLGGKPKEIPGVVFDEQPAQKYLGAAP